MTNNLRELVAAVMAMISMGVLAYLAVAVSQEQAVGAIIAVAAAATGWYLRGRVEQPNP